MQKAAAHAKEALYPRTDGEFAGIIVPYEWKPMEPLVKNTKSYRYVKWGTLVALVILFVLLVLIFTIEIGSAYLSVANLFFFILNSIRHRGNLFILKKGIILNGKYISFQQIKHIETEQIIRWHHLYGLDPKVNNAYMLTIKLKRSLFQPQFIVVETAEHLEKITALLPNVNRNRLNFVETL